MNAKRLLLILVLTPSLAFAGNAENIRACVKKAQEFAAINLDEFAAVYEPNILSMSTARWKNAHCEVKFGEVYSLKINGRDYIHNGYASREAYALHEDLEKKTEDAIRQLKSRISLLENRMDQVNESLKKANPDHAWLAKYIGEGIERATGKQNDTH